MRLSSKGQGATQIREDLMQDAKERPVLLVGSVSLGSSRAVFEAVGTKLGKLVKRIPDGETGARKDWIVWQADVFKNAKGLEPGSTRELQGGYHFILYKVKPGETVKFGPLGYAAAAINSYDDFKRARSEGKIPSGTRFQVSLPTPIAVVMTFTEPDAIQHIWPIYEKRLNEEVADRSGHSAPGPCHPMGHCRGDMLRLGKSGNGESDSDGGVGRLDCPG